MKLETHTQHPHIDEQSWVHGTGGNLKKKHASLLFRTENHSSVWF